MEDYNKIAEDFATKHNIKLTIISSEYCKHFVNDTEKRTIFKLKLSRNKKSFTFKYGQSIAQGSEEPNMYDVLACLTKYDPDTFENFCSDFGYDYYDGKKVYKLVCKEWENVDKLFGDIIEELQEIQ